MSGRLTEERMSCNSERILVLRSLNECISAETKSVAASIQISETVTCDTFSLVPPKPQKPLHVTPFLCPSPTPETVTCDTFFLIPSQAPETVTCDTFSLVPPKLPETVTCDTFSFVPPKPQTPLHVTPFPLSLPNLRNRYM